MEDEIKSQMANGTWELVDLPKGRKAIPCRWVFVVKPGARYKARLVAKGFKQQAGIDYDEIFSPVARFESLRLLLAHAALHDWEVEALDVKTAFLYGELEEEIYMEQPKGFVVPGMEDKVCHLKKVIYGLKQAGRQWNKKLHSALLELGFQRVEADAGVYINRRHKGESLILIVYVDDILPMGVT